MTPSSPANQTEKGANHEHGNGSLCIDGDRHHLGFHPADLGSLVEEAGESRILLPEACEELEADQGSI